MCIMIRVQWTCIERIIYIRHSVRPQKIIHINDNTKNDNHCTNSKFLL